jgi:predicted metalloendopeptidase
VRVTNYYKSCMDEDRIEKEGDAWLQAQLKPIDALPDRAGDPGGDFRPASSRHIGVFRLRLDAGRLNSDHENAGISQGGLSLPNQGLLHARRRQGEDDPRQAGRTYRQDVRAGG